MFDSPKPAEGLNGKILKRCSRCQRKQHVIGDDSEGEFVTDYDMHQLSHGFSEERMEEHWGAPIRQYAH